MTKKSYISALYLCFVLMAAALGVTGCKTQYDNFTYFSNADALLVGQNIPDYEIKAKPGDELRIIISSIVPEATAMYNLPPYTQSTPRSETMTRETNLTTYVISPSGLITMPVLGDLKVQGLTSEQIKREISERVAENVKDPIVSVEFVGFHVTVLGQVNNPHRFTVSTQRFSVLDAIGSCGGVKLSGVLAEVRLLRENQGKFETHVLDLGDANIVNSPYFYMQQNDVLIVDADDVAKSNALYNQMNGFRLSVVSTCVSALSVIASLLIALSK